MITIKPCGHVRQTDMPTDPILFDTLDYILKNDLIRVDVPMCEIAGYEMYVINQLKSSGHLEMNTFAMYLSNSSDRLRGPVTLIAVEELEKPRTERFNPGVRKLFDDRLLAFMSLPPETTRYFKNKQHELHSAAR